MTGFFIFLSVLIIVGILGFGLYEAVKLPPGSPVLARLSAIFHDSGTILVGVVGTIALYMGDILDTLSALTGDSQFSDLAAQIQSMLPPTLGSEMKALLPILMLVMRMRSIARSK
jgi:hypothetical protein